MQYINKLRRQLSQEELSGRAVLDRWARGPNQQQKKFYFYFDGNLNGVTCLVQRENRPYFPYWERTKRGKKKLTDTHLSLSRFFFSSSVHMFMFVLSMNKYSSSSSSSSCDPIRVERGLFTCHLFLVYTHKTVYKTTACAGHPRNDF